MEKISFNSTKIYVDRLYSITLPRDLASTLRDKKWEHASEVYAIYDPKQDQIIIMRNIEKISDVIKKLKMPQAFGLTLINQKNTQAV